MNKCQGCGSVLQCENPNLDGYSKKIDNVLCERCFRIKNYNDYKKVIKTNNDFMPIINNISTTGDLVVLLVDLFSIPKSLDSIINNLNNDILLVLTKRDILPLSIYDERLIEYFNGLSNRIVDTVICSSKKNLNIDEVMDKIYEYKHSNDVYVVGYTNAGKSTMINKILYNYTEKEPMITTSLLPSTTIDAITIEINDSLTLIDTPGLLEEGNILELVDANLLKKIVPRKELKPITYQLKDKQSIIVDSILKIDNEDVNNITLFFSNELEIERSFKKRDLVSNLEMHTLNVDEKEDIVISGLGFIKVMKKGVFHIYTLPGVLVYTRKSFI
jgi:ribosome biogenesis GTPase A